MDVGLYQLYDTPVEYDLTALKPEDIAQIEDWCIDNDIIVEFHVKGPSQKKFMLDISNNRWLPGTTGKYIVPHNLIFNENGSLTVLNHTYYHGSGQYMGGWTITSETTNILLPSWLKYKSKAVIRDAIRKFKGVSESAQDELFTPEQRKNNVIDLTMLRADDFILDDYYKSAVSVNHMHEFRFRPIPLEVMLPNADLNGDIRAIRITCDDNMENMYIDISGFRGFGKQYSALNTYAVDRGLVHQGHNGEYHYGMDIRLPQWMFYRMKKEIKEEERQEAKTRELFSRSRSIFEQNMGIEQDEMNLTKEPWAWRTLDLTSITPDMLRRTSGNSYGTRFDFFVPSEYSSIDPATSPLVQYGPNKMLLLNIVASFGAYNKDIIYDATLYHPDSMERLNVFSRDANILMPKWLKYQAYRYSKGWIQ